MIDPNGYREMLMARVNAIKAEQREKESRLAELTADLRQLLSPLTALGNLLPKAVRDILEKYRNE